LPRPAARRAAAAQPASAARFESRPNQAAQALVGVLVLDRTLKRLHLTLSGIFLLLLCKNQRNQVALLHTLTERRMEKKKKCVKSLREAIVEAKINQPGAGVQ
jgi:hypothetical protein